MRFNPSLAFAYTFLLIFTFACNKGDANLSTNTVSNTFTVISSAFTNNGILPKKYTCDSLGISPPLSWANAPAGTTSFAVTMHTVPPTPPNHAYIVIFNIPTSVTSLQENTSGIGTWGINSVNGQQKYTPPCSQGPGAKIYTLTVYALSSAPLFSVPASQVTLDILLTAISTKTLASSVINVSYTR